MKYTFLAILTLILVVQSCSEKKLESESSDQNKLIPREALFSDHELINFQLSPDGETVYYEDVDQINFITSFSERERTRGSIKFEGGKFKWKALNDGILLASGDSLKGLTLIKKNGDRTKLKFEIPAINISFIKNSKQQPNLWIIKVDAPNTSETGFYQYDLATETTLKLEIPPLQTVHFDDNFNPVAGNEINENGEVVIYYFDPKQSTWTPIVTHPFDEGVIIGGFQRVLSVSNNGEYIYFTSNYKTDKTVLKSFHVSSREIKVLAENELVDLLPFGLSTDDQGHVTSVVGLFAKTIRICLDSSTQKDFEFLSGAIEGDIGFVAASYDGQKWLVREFTGADYNYFFYDRNDRRSLIYLIDDLPDLRKHRLAQRYAHSVMTSDSLKLPVHVYLPPGSDEDGDGIPENPLPTILYVHGGPWLGIVQWNGHYFTRNFQLLANRGYAVVNCEFRGSSGYGKDFINKSNKQWGKNMLRDKVEIANWAVQKKIAQSNNIAMWGWSYGGSATMIALAFSPNTFKCGVAMYGISDFVSVSKLPYFNSELWKTRVGDANNPQDKKMLENFSPINSVANITSPLLMTTGSLDQVVPQQQMDTMALELSKNKKEVVYFYYPEEGHDYKNKESWTSFWAITEQFLSKNLGGSYEPVKNEVDSANLVIQYGEDFVKTLDRDN